MQASGIGILARSAGMMKTATVLMLLHQTARTSRTSCQHGKGRATCAQAR